MARSLLAEHERLEANIRALDEKIYKLETSYFEKAPEIGNIVQGWCTSSNSLKSEQRKAAARPINDEDRIFSNTSASSAQVRIPHDFCPGTWRHSSTKFHVKRGKRRQKKSHQDDESDATQLNLFVTMATSSSKERGWKIYFFLRARGRQFSPQDSMCHVLLIKPNVFSTPASFFIFVSWTHEFSHRISASGSWALVSVLVWKMSLQKASMSAQNFFVSFFDNPSIWSSCLGDRQAHKIDLAWTQDRPRNSIRVQFPRVSEF